MNLLVEEKDRLKRPVGGKRPQMVGEGDTIQKVDLEQQHWRIDRYEVPREEGKREGVEERVKQKSMIGKQKKGFSKSKDRGGEGTTGYPLVKRSTDIILGKG